MKVDFSKPKVILDAFVEVDHTRVDPELYSQVTDYKSRVASKFKSISKRDIAHVQGNEFYISLKLDGEHCHLYYEDNQICLIRPRGYAYTGLPCLEKAREVLGKAGIKKALIPGELYALKEDGSRSRIFDVITLTQSPKSQADLEMLNFAPFDILTLDDEIFMDRAEVVRRLETLFGHTHTPPPITIISKNRDDIYTYYDQWVNRSGAEGLMIRSDLTYRYKLKAQHTLDAAIIGYTAENEMVTSVLTGLVTPDGHIQVLSAVEKGFTDVDRISLYQELCKITVESDYLEVSRFHTPFFMVYPKKIIEFTCNDMVAERGNGQPIKKSMLKLKKGRYTLLRSSALVSLKHCVFNRFRDDKQVNPVDLRLSQITDFIFIELDKQQADIKFPATKLLKREVFIKTVRNKTAIRKLVAWQTNKEKIDSSYTPYVFNFTDYSSGRKDPLKQDVRISNSKAQIMDIYREFKEKHIKAGWQDVAEEPRQQQLDDAEA